MKTFFPVFPILWAALLAPQAAWAQIGPKPEGVFRIAVLACHRQFEPAPALNRYLDLQADLCLWIGDNVYADAPEDPAFIQLCYDTLGAKPAFRQLLKTDYLATWDDHDFGLNDAGASYRFKRESKNMFRRFWQLEQMIPADQEGIYYGKILRAGNRNVQILMLDVRYNREQPGPVSDVLGEVQWAWLENQLRQPADLRLIVSGFQILLDADAGSETWDRFPKAKERLFETIRRTKAEGVVFLTGDQHYAEVSRLPGALDYDAIELQFAGINQIETAEFNPLRVTPVIASKHSAAVIDLQPDSTESDVPNLLFQVEDVLSGKTEISYRVNLQETALSVAFSPPTRFMDSLAPAIRHGYPNLHIRYTLDGSEPHAGSPLYSGPFVIRENTVVKAALFTREGFPRSGVFSQTYEKLLPLKPIQPKGKPIAGLRYGWYPGTFSRLPDFSRITPDKQGITTDLSPKNLSPTDDHYALLFDGLIEVPETGLYDFYIGSDDGSRLWIDGQMVADNDGSHSYRRRHGLIALEKGFHAIRLAYFEDHSGQKLDAGYTLPGGETVKLTGAVLFHSPK